MKPYSLTDYTNLPVDSAALTSFFMLIFDCCILFWHPFTSMTVLLSINFQCRQLITRCIWRRTPWLTLGGTEGCCVVPRCCLALLMDRWSSWTAMAECWPTCSFMSQTESSTCPGTTPASWWRTAARATPTPTTIPHHKVGWCAHPPVSALHLLMKTSPMPGCCHALQNQQGFVSSSFKLKFVFQHSFKLSWSRELVWESGFVIPVLLCLHLHKWDNHTKLDKFSVRVSEKQWTGTCQISLISRYEVLQGFVCMEVVRVQPQKLMHYCIDSSEKTAALDMV